MTSWPGPPRLYQFIKQGAPHSVNPALSIVNDFVTSVEGDALSFRRNLADVYGTYGYVYGYMSMGMYHSVIVQSSMW